MKQKNHVLRGWKEIEEYLGLTRKTIIRRGLPVYKDGGVYALPEELDKAQKEKKLLK